MDNKNLGMIRPHHSKLVFVFRLIDATLIFMSLYVAMLVYGIEISEQYLMLGIIAVASFSLFSEGLNVLRQLIALLFRAHNGYGACVIALLTKMGQGKF